MSLRSSQRKLFNLGMQPLPTLMADKRTWFSCEKQVCSTLSQWVIWEEGERKASRNIPEIKYIFQGCAFKMWTKFKLLNYCKLSKNKAEQIIRLSCTSNTKSVANYHHVSQSITLKLPQLLACGKWLQYWSYKWVSSFPIPWELLIIYRNLLVEP